VGEETREIHMRERNAYVAAAVAAASAVESKEREARSHLSSAHHGNVWQSMATSTSGSVPLLPPLPVQPTSSLPSSQSAKPSHL
jgi:hypothetical protein